MARTVGLRDIYMAKVTANTPTEYTTGTPEKLARAISAKVNEKWSSQKIYSDDSLEGIARNFDSAEIELEVARLIFEKIAIIYGQDFLNGFLTGASEDQAADIALGWRNKLDNGKYQFCWYYCVTPSDGVSNDYTTSADKIKVGSDKFKLTGRPREKADTDGKHRYVIKVSEDELLAENTDAKTAIQNWFSAVQEPVLTKAPELSKE